MAAFSDYLENKVLDHLFGNTPFATPNTIYFALFTTAPSDAGGGVEVSGNGYARAAIQNTDANWSPAASGQKRNSVVLAFPEASGSWGTVIAIGIFDAATGGNLLLHSTINSRTVVAGDVPRFAVNGISVALN
jgi:hypothetical protein